MNTRLACRALFTSAAIALLCGSGACRAGEAAGGTSQGYNIIMIVVDCLRADHLSLYGYNRKTSPNIDAFAGEAVVFRQAIAQANNTPLSFASIFTSRNVPAHGLDSTKKALSESALTLAEILRIYNYRTAAFVGGHLLDPRFKLDQGFEKYLHIDRTDASFKDTLPAALQWIEEKTAKNEKFFVVAHGNEIHTPYAFPATSLYDKGSKIKRGLFSDGSLYPSIHKRTARKKTGEKITFSDDEVNHLVARYDEGINYADGFIGDFLDGLRAKGLFDRTIVILTADHGEGLFDHDYFFHSLNLYEDTLWVPLIIKAPGMGARDIPRQVQLIDLMPTVLEFAGIAPPADAQGRSLKPLLLGEEPDAGFDRDNFSQSVRGGKVIRSGRWKLIWYPKLTELFDLVSDPGERHNLAETEKGTAAALREKLFSRLAGDEKDANPDAKHLSTKESDSEMD